MQRGSLGAELLGLLDAGGTLISYGALAGKAVPIAPSALISQGVAVRGVSIGRWTSTRTLDERAEVVAFAVELARPDLPEVAAGHQVILSNRRGPGSLTDLVHDLGPLASAASPAEAAEAEMVLLAVGWTAIPAAIAGTSVTDWADRIVIDATKQ